VEGVGERERVGEREGEREGEGERALGLRHRNIEIEVQATPGTYFPGLPLVTQRKVTTCAATTSLADVFAVGRVVGGGRPA